MNAMIDAMLSLAQLSSQPLARQPVNLSQLAAYILEDLRRGQPDRVVAVEIEPDLQVTGDPTLLRLVLENLLSNAWKYTGKTASPSIELRASQEQGQRVFEVRDNGAGFDMRSSDRLFGLFQRLHSANDFPGTGVGLASVQRIVRRHGGDIWALSTPGQGARFCFTIKT
jgi:signal transduction histidine kinase